MSSGRFSPPALLALLTHLPTKLALARHALRRLSSVLYASSLFLFLSSFEERAGRSVATTVGFRIAWRGG